MGTVLSSFDTMLESDSLSFYKAFYFRDLSQKSLQIENTTTRIIKVAVTNMNIKLVNANLVAS
jgi:hypothetical protein